MRRLAPRTVGGRCGHGRSRWSSRPRCPGGSAGIIERAHCLFGYIGGCRWSGAAAVRWSGRFKRPGTADRHNEPDPVLCDHFRGARALSASWASPISGEMTVAGTGLDRANVQLALDALDLLAKRMSLAL